MRMGVEQDTQERCSASRHAADEDERRVAIINLICIERRVEQTVHIRRIEGSLT